MGRSGENGGPAVRFPRRALHRGARAELQADVEIAHELAAAGGHGKGDGPEPAGCAAEFLRGVEQRGARILRGGVEDLRGLRRAIDRAADGAVVIEHMGAEAGASVEAGRNGITVVLGRHRGIQPRIDRAGPGQAGPIEVIQRHRHHIEGIALTRAVKAVRGGEDDARGRSSEGEGGRGHAIAEGADGRR